MQFLVDNDVLLSAIYRKHENHPSSRAWLDSSKAEGWGIAAETYLACIRLLMNPSLMGAGALTAEQAIRAVDTELGGEHPGRVVMAAQVPDRQIIAQAKGHRQVMDFWLIQIAKESGARLATRDGGILNAWPLHAVEVV